jgi:antitoxin component YwqK of YwqJK toxin-antitoxin module
VDNDQWADSLLWHPNATIEGKEVKLKMRRRTETEVSEIESAKALKPNEGCSAYYYYLNDGNEVLHGPAYSWKANGKIEQKAFNFGGKLKYLQRYYPTGEVINSIIYDKTLNQLITNWYDQDGNIVGKYVLNNKLSCEMTQDDNKYFWNGKSISAEEYSQKIEPYMIMSLQ